VKWLECYKIASSVLTFAFFWDFKFISTVPRPRLSRKKKNDNLRYGLRTRSQSFLSPKQSWRWLDQLVQNLLMTKCFVYDLHRWSKHAKQCFNSYQLLLSLSRSRKSHDGEQIYCLPPIRVGLWVIRAFADGLMNRVDMKVFAVRDSGNWRAMTCLQSLFSASKPIFLIGLRVPSGKYAKNNSHEWTAWVRHKPWDLIYFHWKASESAVVSVVYLHFTIVSQIYCDKRNYTRDRLERGKEIRRAFRWLRECWKSEKNISGKHKSQ
jgi:hypothetical protein